MGLRTRWNQWGWAALTVLLALVPSVIWPGDTFWIFDEPAEVAIGFRANQAGTLAVKGLSGNFYVHYGPLPMQIYQAMLLVSHDPRVLVVLKAILCSLVLAGSLVWLGRSLRLSFWFAAAVVIAPQLWLNNRILWAANFAIPCSILAVAAYAAFLRKGGGAALATALGASIAMGFIHPQSAPLSAAILGHMFWRNHRAMLRHWPGVLAVLALLTVLHYRYLEYAIPTIRGGFTWFARTGYPEQMAKMNRAQAMLGPLMGGRLFAGGDFQEAYQRTPGPAGLLKVIAILSNAAIPLVWLGVVAAIAQQVRRCCTPTTPSPGTPGEGRGEGSCANTKALPVHEQTLTLTLSRSTGRGDKSSDSARRSLLSIALAAFILQALYFGLLRVPPQPQYFFGTFGLHVLLAWFGVELIKPLALRAVIVALFALALATITLGSLWGIHRHGWPPGTASPTLNEQIQVVRELNRYTDRSIHTNVFPYLFDPPHALNVLRLLFPPDAAPASESGRLVIRYRTGPAGRTGRVELIEARTDADIPPDARRATLDDRR